MNLSKNFTLEELTVSDAGERLGLDNSPPPDVVFHLERLCEDILEPTRMMLGKPIFVNSGYRSPEVNEAIGGSKTSEHMDGRAADFRVPHMTPYEVCRRLEAQIDLMPINQLIHEFGRWVHVSIAKLGEEPKRQLLTAMKKNGQTVYVPGIVPV